MESLLALNGTHLVLAVSDAVAMRANVRRRGEAAITVNNATLTTGAMLKTLTYITNVRLTGERREAKQGVTNKSQIKGQQNKRRKGRSQSRGAKRKQRKPGEEKARREREREGGAGEKKKPNTASDHLVARTNRLFLICSNA